MLFASTFVLAQAQDSYHPLLQKGKQWNYKFDAMIKTANFSEWVEGDSVVNGITYAKVFAATDDTTRLSMLMREEGEKIYALVPNDEDGTKKEVLMYDFGLREGDKFTSDDCIRYYIDVMSCTTFATGGICSLTVDKVDTILVNGERRRRITILRDWGGMTGDPYVWVEGIGGLFGLTWPPTWNFIIDGKVASFLSCNEDGVCIFRTEDFNAPAWTGSTAGMERLGMSQQDTGMTFDLQGRRAGIKATGGRATLGNGPGRAGTGPGRAGTGPAPTRGVYIKDGSKIVVR